MRWGIDRTRGVAAACTLILGACASADRAARCADGLDDVVYAGVLPDSAERVEFRELWRVGGVTEGEHLAVPLPVAVSEEGRAAVADFMLGDLIVIEADGTWRGSLARRGMGPGELSSPVAAVWTGDGALHVYDLARPAILRFDRGLAYVGETRVESEAAAAVYASGSLDWAGVQPSGATVLMPGLSRVEDGFAREVVLRVATGAASADTLRSGTVATVSAGDFEDRAVPGSSRIAASIGAGGRLAMIGGSAGSVVDVLRNDGSVALRFCGDAPDQPLSAAERGRGVEDRYRPLADAYAAAEAPARPAAHGRVVTGADGTLWVERDRPDPYPRHMRHYGDPGSTFDVFSADGHHRRTLRLPQSARLQGALGDTIWVYEIGDMEDVSLAAYEILTP